MASSWSWAALRLQVPGGALNFACLVSISPHNRAAVQLSELHAMSREAALVMRCAAPQAEDVWQQILFQWDIATAGAAQHAAQTRGCTCMAATHHASLGSPSTTKTQHEPAAHMLCRCSGHAVGGHAGLCLGQPARWRQGGPLHLTLPSCSSSSCQRCLHAVLVCMSHRRASCTPKAVPHPHTRPSHAACCLCGHAPDAACLPASAADS